MKLQELLTGAPSHRQLRGSANLQVGEICQDSRRVRPGDLFVAVTGTQVDSHNLLAQVVLQNPSALVVENIDKIPSAFSGAVIQVSNSRLFLDFLANRWFGEPSSKLTCVAVTGTNGKTTTTNIIEHIFNDQGQPTGVIGTIDHHLGSKVWATANTTPGSLELHFRLSEFVREGAKAAALEVTSHGLTQHRGELIDLDAAIFTNLTRDHLDYHLTMENYFNAKATLFTNWLLRSKKKNKIAVIGVDSEYGKKLVSQIQVPTLTYGQSASDLQFEIQNEDLSGTRVQFKYQGTTHHVQLKIPCRYNVYNSMGALGAALGLKLDLDQSLQSLESFSGVKGRLERVKHSQSFHVFVDYAHTDDALKNVLNSLNVLRKTAGTKGRIITVFGCGGGRDKGKRPLMAKAAVSGSDIVIVTSDNPRTENPDSIVQDILAGVSRDILGKSVLSEVQRREAIAMALNMARDEDVVLIAGKGHEDYQQIGDQKFPFSDVLVAREFLK